MGTSAAAEWRVKEVRVDYVTLTARRQETRKALIVFGQTITVAEQRSGADVRPFAWQGYRGLSAGHVTWGDREDGSLLRLGGDLAAHHWRTAARAYDNCTRLDLAVTARRSPPARQLAEVAFERAREEIERGASNGLTSLVMDNRGGQTCYIGSRTSDRFARLYDKEKESAQEEYAGCWRWELETKGDVAVALLRQLVRADDAGPLARATVHQHFTSKGCRPPWPSTGEPAALSIKKPESDDATRLRWLRDQVAPSVARLTERGKLIEVLRALGLGDLVRLLDAWAERPEPRVADGSQTE